MHLRHVPGRDDAAGLAFHHQLVEGAGVGRDDRNTTCHGFQRSDAETLPALGRYEQVERLIPLRHGVYRRLGQEQDSVFEPDPGHFLAEDLQKRPMLSRRTAHDQSSRAGMMRQDFKHCVDEYIRALLVADASETPDGDTL